MGCSESKATNIIDNNTMEIDNQVDEATQAMCGNYSLSSRLDVFYIYIQMTIYCSHLPKLDVMSKSDPMVVISQKSKDGKWYEVGRTEVLIDDDKYF